MACQFNSNSPAYPPGSTANDSRLILQEAIHNLRCAFLRTGLLVRLSNRGNGWGFADNSRIYPSKGLYSILHRPKPDSLRKLHFTINRHLLL